MKFAWVPPGSSWLGGGGSKRGTTPFTLEHGLWCGIYPVTQAEWQQVMGSNPSHFKDNPRYPVESVSWNDVQKFLENLNARDGDYSYRLPTEQEWEYICRGGPISQDQTKYDYYFAKSKTDLTPNPLDHSYRLWEKANLFGYLKNPSDVGSYLPNPLGIFDMHGNVWEWTDSSEGSGRLVRGGGWSSGSESCTAACRNGTRRTIRTTTSASASSQFHKSRAGPSVRPPSDHVSLPQFAERVLFQPVLQPSGSSRSNVEQPSRRLTVMTSSASKWSISAAGLCSDQQLTMPGGRFQQVGQHGQGRRVKSQFRFVQHDQSRQILFRLKQKREQGDGPERAVGQLVRSEIVFGPFAASEGRCSAGFSRSGSRTKSSKNGATAFTAATIRRYAVG